MKLAQDIIGNYIGDSLDQKGFLQGAKEKEDESPI
jgi:hypothetical protein